jgi:hypothetical protein
MGVRIGCATAWSGDQFAPATVLVERGDIDYIFFESMSEATMSLAQVRLAEDPSKPGYDPFLGARLRPIMRACRERSVTIVSNQGWLDPKAAAEEVARLAREEGLSGVKIAAVVSNALMPELACSELRLLETNELVTDRWEAVVSAEAYLGAWEIAQALDDGADIVITSRVTDASLVLGPLIHEFGWGRQDWDKLGRGVVIGHLLECAGQVSGGNFADPGYKSVDGLIDLGHPIADVDEDTAIITKPDGTGGLVSMETCKEQLLYEVGNPARYLNPDVTADFTSVSFESAGPDRVRVIGGSGGPPPETLKVLVGIREGFFSEEMMLFAGPGALERAKVAEDVVTERLEQLDFRADALRCDYVGVNAVHREATPPSQGDSYEVALRIAARAESADEIRKLGDAVAPMAVSGPTGIGKWGTLSNHTRPIVAMYSLALPREMVSTSVSWVES